LWSGEHLLETVGVHNGKKETTVVTHEGYYEGKRFEGYDMRARERHEGPIVAAMRCEGDCGGNGSNPMAGCRVQQTYEAICGVNRRSREERQGRKVCVAWRLHAEGRHLEREADPDRTQVASVGGGVFFGKPQERKFDWMTQRRDVSALNDEDSV